MWKCRPLPDKGCLSLIYRMKISWRVEIKSVCEFWVLTRPVPRRKTCCWLAQGITDHSWLAPHLPTASHGLAHCTAALRSAHWGPGHEGCPQFFRGNVRPVQPPAYPYSYLPTYNGRKIRVNVNVLWFSRFSKIPFDPFLRTVVSLRWGRTDAAKSTLFVASVNITRFMDKFLSGSSHRFVCLDFCHHAAQLNVFTEKSVYFSLRTDIQPS